MKTTRKLLLLVLIIAICCAVMSAQASAASNSCGDNLTWSFDTATNTLTISGTGDMYDYTLNNYYTNAPWRGYQSSVKAIVIKEGVTSIGNYAFHGLFYVETVSIPSSVTSIGYHAFGYNSWYKSFIVAEDNLYYSSSNGVLYNEEKTELLRFAEEGVQTDTFTVPDTVVRIADYAFEGSSYKLSHLVLGDSVQEIGDYAFDDCTELITVTNATALRTIGDHAFASNYYLTTVSGLQNLQFIGDYAFANCYDLSTFDPPVKLESIGDYAFSECTDLETFSLPEGLTSIGNFAFFEDWQLSLTIPSTVKEIGEAAFADVQISLAPGNEFFRIASGLLMDTAQTKVYALADLKTKTCVIPDSVTEISPYAFYTTYGYALQEVMIPSGVTEIKEYTFAGCYDLRYIHLSEGLKRIDDYAFGGCSATRIVLPASVESVGKAFGSYLQQLYFLGDAPEFETNYSSLSEDLVLYYIPSNAGWSSGWNGYTTATWSGNTEDLNTLQWSLINGVLTISGEGEVTIDSNDQAPWWYRREEVTNMIISEGITELGALILDDLPNLRTLSLPSTLTDTYFSTSFPGCHSLRKITVAAGNTAYASENGALLNSDKTELIFVPFAIEGTFTISSSVKTVRSDAFKDCSKLTEIVIPDSVSKWGNCSSAETMSYFNAESFCDALMTITVSGDNPLFTAEDGILFSKDKTRLLWFPSGKTGNYTVPAGVEKIAYRAFFHSSITELYIPASVTGIGLGSASESAYPVRSYAYFDGCKNLTGIHVDSDNTAYCSVEGVLYDKSMAKLLVVPNGLTEYTIPDSVTNASFYSTPTGLKSLHIGENAKNVPFQKLVDLESVTVHEDNLNYYVIDDVVYSRDGKILYWCPRDYEGVFSIPEGVTSIATSAFQNCTRLTDVEFPTSLRTIGRRAFAGCTGLTELSFSTPDLSINTVAFIGCTDLEKVVFESSVIVANGAFADCYALSEVVVSSDCTINVKAFIYCENLETAFFPGTPPTTLIRGSFAKCSADLALYYFAGTPGWQNPLCGYPTNAVSSCDQEGHRVVIDPAVDPTVGEDGLTEGTHCSVCGAVLIQQIPVPALISDAVFGNGVLTLYADEQMPHLFVAAYDATGRMTTFHIAVWDGTKYTVTADAAADAYRWTAFCMDDAFAPLSCMYDLLPAN